MPTGEEPGCAASAVFFSSSIGYLTSWCAGLALAAWLVSWTASLPPPRDDIFSERETLRLASCRVCSAASFCCFLSSSAIYSRALAASSSSYWRIAFWAAAFLAFRAASASSLSFEVVPSSESPAPASDYPSPALALVEPAVWAGLPAAGGVERWLPRSGVPGLLVSLAAAAFIS